MSGIAERTARETVQLLREANAPAEVALHSDTRTVVDNSGSIYINPTKFGERMLGLAAKDEVEVLTFGEPRCIVIVPSGDVEEHPVDEAIERWEDADGQ